MIATLAAALVVAQLACGGDGGDSDSTDHSDRNVVVREEIVHALATDTELQAATLDTIGKVKANQYDLQQALDGLVDQTKVLTSLIVDVAAPEEPPDADLAEAQDLTEEYLRNRVHQLELALSALSGEELEALYLTDKAGLDAARNRVHELLIRYSPELEKTLQ